MTRGLSGGDRGRWAPAARLAPGVRPNEATPVHAGASRPSTNGMQSDNGRHSLTRSGGSAYGQLNELVEHVAVAVTRHVRHLRQDALPVPPSVDELAAMLVRCVQTRPTATPVEDKWTLGSRADHDDQVMGRRLLVTKAEAAELLGVSVRTIERLIAAGQLPLLHIERASRLRLADIEAYIDSLVGGQVTPEPDDHGP